MKIPFKIPALIKTILIFILAMLAAFVLYELGLRAENIFLIGLLAVIVTIVESKSFWYGFAVSILFVFAFNFFFTEPRFTFLVSDANYYVSFVLFLVFAVIANTLTTQLQKEMSIAKNNEEVTSKLNKIGGGFLNLSGVEQIMQYGKRCLADLTKHEVEIICGAPPEVEKAASYCYRNSIRCGAGTSAYSESDHSYFPLSSKNATHGVVKVEGDLSVEESKLIETVISQITLALDREMMAALEEKNRLQAEKENLRSSLLRSISHDLRTPLTGIAGGAELLLSDFNQIDPEAMKSVLKDIASDASWLSNMVENLLNMTRIQDGRLTITKKNEVVDDLIGEAVSKVRKLKNEHKLIVEKPDEMLLVPADGQLIVQVLLNLIDNAFKHTRIDSSVWMRVYSEKPYTVFEITDNGGGIKADKIDRIFESFFTAEDNRSDKKLGMGLGLSICKSIIEAHGGKITAENNSISGATFKFYLPEVETK